MKYDPRIIYAIESILFNESEDTLSRLRAGDFLLGQKEHIEGSHKEHIAAVKKIIQNKTESPLLRVMAARILMP